MLTSDDLGAQGWSLALGRGTEGGQVAATPGRCQASDFSSAFPDPTGPARGDLCHGAQRAEGELWVSVGWRVGGGAKATARSHLPYVRARETLALLGLRGWQESLGALASLGPLG